jgi:hypothetical protein
VGGIKMDLKYYPVHLTHVIVSLIAFSSLIAINYIEFNFTHIDNTGLFFVMMQNAILGSANSYWLIKTHITPSQAEIETSQAQSK